LKAQGLIVDNKPLLVFPKIEFVKDGSVMQYSEDRATGIVSAVTHSASGGMGMLDYELDPDVLSELKKNSVGVPIINAYYKNKSTMTKVIVSFFA